MFGQECGNILGQTGFPLMPVNCSEKKCIYEICSMSIPAGVNLRGVKMSYSVKIIPLGLIVAHFSTECQTKSALQRMRCLTRVLGDHMLFKKCAPKVREERAAQQ